MSELRRRVRWSVHVCVMVCRRSKHQRLRLLKYPLGIESCRSSRESLTAEVGRPETVAVRRSAANKRHPRMQVESSTIASSNSMAVPI